MKKIILCFLILLSGYAHRSETRCGGAIAGGILGGFAAGAFLGSALSNRRCCPGRCYYPPPAYYYYGPCYPPPGPGYWY